MSGPILTRPPNGGNSNPTIRLLVQYGALHACSFVRSSHVRPVVTRATAHRTRRARRALLTSACPRILCITKHLAFYHEHAKSASD